MANWYVDNDGVAHSHLPGFFPRNSHHRSETSEESKDVRSGWPAVIVLGSVFLTVIAAMSLAHRSGMQFKRDFSSVSGWSVDVKAMEIAEAKRQIVMSWSSLEEELMKCETTRSYHPGKFNPAIMFPMVNLSMNGLRARDAKLGKELVQLNEIIDHPERFPNKAHSLAASRSRIHKHVADQYIR